VHESTSTVLSSPNFQPQHIHSRQPPPDASTHLLAHAHELKVTPLTTTINSAWKLLRDYKGDDASASPQLPSQMRTNISADK